LDSNRLDSLVRRLLAAPSRRDLAHAVAGFSLSGLLVTLGQVTDTEAGKRKRKRKRKRKKTCQGGTKTCGETCIPSASCCSSIDCDAGAECLANGSCATVCTVTPQCPPPCICGLITPEGPAHCIAGGLTSCDQVPQKCSGNAQCPSGQHCQQSTCGPGNSQEARCVPLCAA